MNDTPCTLTRATVGAGLGAATMIVRVSLHPAIVGSILAVAVLMGLGLVAAWRRR